MRELCIPNSMNCVIILLSQKNRRFCFADGVLNVFPLTAPISITLAQCGIMNLSREARAFLFSPTNSRYPESVRASLDKNSVKQDGGFLIVNMKTKRCAKCGDVKPIHDFYKDFLRKDNHHSYCKECMKNYHDERPEANKKSRDKYRSSNLEKCREASNAWKAKHPDEHAIHAQNRYALQIGNGGSITVDEWKQLKERYNYTCLCCGRKEPKIKLELDHVLPLACGGKNVIQNAQPLCRHCNASKHTKHVDYRSR